MSMSKENQPAFPCYFKRDDGQEYYFEGITQLEFFAAAALIGLLARGEAEKYAPGQAFSIAHDMVSESKRK